VVLLPTAYTHPRGTFYASSYDIVFLQVGYALTDHTQFSVTATPPFEGGIVGLDFTLKSVLFRQGRVRAAALGSATGLTGMEDLGVLFLGRAGGVVQLCARPACDTSSLVIGSNVTLAGPVLMMVNGVGAIWRLGRWVSALVEVDTLVPLGAQGGQWNGVFVSAGLRFPFTRWGLDLAFGRSPGAGADSPTIPLLAVSYRWVPEAGQH
jgi:hypothetical protein